MHPPGRLCIDFTHTLSGSSGDRLTSYAALVDWAERAGALGSADPDEAADVHRRAVRFRDDLYAVLTSASEGTEPDPQRLETLNATLREAAQQRALVHGPEGYEWSWTPKESNRPQRILWSVAHSAVDLLTSEWLDRVGVCDEDTCGWLFIDESRNRSRRWCDMKDCGNRAKVRRYRARARRS
jgi:predicted RNA-binding Zn ribbon-like protein